MKKRYESEAQIVRDIDRIKAMNEADLAKSIALDKGADELFKWCNENPRETEEFREKYHAARNVRHKAEILKRGIPSRELRLRHLKETLAVFRTQPFQFMSNASVTEQPLRV